MDASRIEGTLTQVVAGKFMGHRPEDLWTLFLLGGTGIEDVAVATRLYELAHAKGVGTKIEFGRSYAFEF